jgi:hypothetical protein
MSLVGFVKFFHLVGFEVLTPMVMKSSIFFDITPCSQLKVNRRFGRTCRPHLQGRRMSQARIQPENSAYHLLSLWFLAWLILRSRRWRRHVPPKCRLTFNGLHGVISQKRELFVPLVSWFQTQQYLRLFFFISLF